MEKVRTILENGLIYVRDDEGGIVMKNAKTVNRYVEIDEEMFRINVLKFDCFFAFSDTQFDEGMRQIRKLKDGETLVYYGSGLYGTEDGMRRYREARRAKKDRMKKECDPQEVYFYEWNNHECMYDWDAEGTVYRLVEDIFGEKKAKGLHRIRY